MSERVEQFVYKAAFNPAASLKVTMKYLLHAVLFLSSNPLSTKMHGSNILYSSLYQCRETVFFLPKEI